MAHFYLPPPYSTLCRCRHLKKGDWFVLLMKKLWNNTRETWRAAWAQCYCTAVVSIFTYFLPGFIHLWHCHSIFCCHRLVIYKKMFILAHISGGWQVQEYGTGNCVASGEGLVLQQNMVETENESGHMAKRKTQRVNWISNNLPSWQLVTAHKNRINLLNEQVSILISLSLNSYI
jgi:hypothetical protein